MLSLDQQRLTLSYALVFLKKEIKNIEKSIEQCKHQKSKDYLTRRCEELKLDLEKLQPIGDSTY